MRNLLAFGAGLFVGVGIMGSAMTTTTPHGWPMLIILAGLCVALMFIPEDHYK